MSTPATTTTTFAVWGPISQSDLPGLCDRVCAELSSTRAGVAFCDVQDVQPDAVTVEALARLQLAARRAGCKVCLRGASRELLELVGFMGLTDVLPEYTTESGGTMATTTPRKIFVNLAVKDLDRSVDFFTKLGFSFDPRFTDESTTCMIVGDDAYVMLLVEDRFKDFTKKDLADPSTQTEAIVALSAQSRAEVDELAEKALAAGASPANDPYELDSMYGRSFNDPDGHLWELIWMDPSALEQ